LVLAPAAGFLCDIKGRAFSLSELSAERLELCAARFVESAEKADRSVIRHLSKLKEGLVRCQKSSRKVLFGARYVSSILRAINSALSTTLGGDRTRILPTFT
jgi:hypothetical protein